MHKKPVTAALTNPAASRPQSTTTGTGPVPAAGALAWKTVLARRTPSRAPAPTMTGVERRKEYLAAAERFTSRNIAVLMVIPLRETPGISASAWLMPMQKQSAQVKSWRERLCLLFLSAAKSTKANTTSIRAEISGDRK